MVDPLDAFSAPVRVWFEETFGKPTPPQAQGWPSIQRGEHTLILAPTGSGKTLAAFLWGIDDLFRRLQTPDGELKAEGSKRAAGTRQSANLAAAARPGEKATGRKQAEQEGVQLLYVSPLKALNNDIERNLRAPLDGIRAVAARQHLDLAPLRVAVRTGDTPSHLRSAMLRHPPHILITTPESLYLMLTSPRAREMFRTVRTVIVDEIHTLCGNKRGVHLSLSLERLEHLAIHPVQRIGLSATIKPLEEVARFLGGQEPVGGIWSAKTAKGRENRERTAESPNHPITYSPTHHLTYSPHRQFTPRPVTLVDAGYHKPLDLRVITAVEDFRELPGDTVWPSIIPRVLQDIRTHRHTLVFSNNRRLAERTADRLNAQLAAEEAEEIPPGSPEALAPQGVARDRGIFAIGASGPIRAHHGSMSKEARRRMEDDLKAGRLPALVGTSSLELGIDIGSIDLVVQLQSPKSVAQGLQRVGRSGHLVGETSIGHIYPTFREDLMEAAAVARGMLDGDVEPTFTPKNPLDVLAQQIVAMVAVEDWSVPALFNLVRQAYAYSDLTPDAFRSVLEMLSGKYADVPSRDLRARISWDRVNDRLSALPGSRLAASMNGGTISDTGAYPVYLGDGKTKVGELDEEFIFETRPGDTFLLGSRVWRVLQIEDDRVVVGDAAGAVPRMPFWHGDYPWRPYSLGVRVGKFRGEIAEKIKRNQGNEGELKEWLEREYALDENSARNLIEHVRRQLDAVGVISSDTTIVVESFQDAIGEPRLVIHSPFGGRINGAWALALTSLLRERTGTQPEVQSNDDGIIFRFPNSTRSAPVDLVRELTPESARERILRELGNSALFGAHFRMNAARALLLPQARGRRRTPFWLQRLKAKDLLALVRQFDDFPIVAETYRDCLRDVLDMPHLEQVLSRISTGEIRMVPIETAVPSPVASGLLFQFINVYMYEWDAPKAERQLQSLSFQREALEQLTRAPGAGWRELVRPEVVKEVSDRAQHLAPNYRARTAEELAVHLGELGDLTDAEIAARSEGDAGNWIRQLAAQGRIVAVDVPTSQGPEKRWVPVELLGEYRALAQTSPLPPLLPVEGGEGGTGEVLARILRRLLRNSGPLTRQAILDRYAFPPSWLAGMLDRLVATREIVRGQFTGGETGAVEEFCDRCNLGQMHRRTLTVLRREVEPVSRETYADFLVRWQHAHPAERLPGSSEDLRGILEQLRGISLPGVVWERDVLPGRLAEYDPQNLDLLCQNGELIWAAAGQDPRRTQVHFFFRGEGALFLTQPDPVLSPAAQSVYDYLQAEGALFTTELGKGVGLKADLLLGALAELVLAGRITNDAVETLRRLSVMLPSGATGLPSPEIATALQTELAARFPGPRPLTRGRYYDAKRRVARRLRGGPMLTSHEGRWSVLHRPSVMGPPLTDEERADRLARVLLARYGVVAREMVVQEGTPDWALLFQAWQRMELRGEVRRGYFVSGLSGVQFALPEAVERLRAARTSGDDVPVALNATDPANVPDGELSEVPLRFSRVPSTWCVLSQGRPILVAEENGERIVASARTDADLIRRALYAFLTRPHAPRHLTVSRWNGAPVLGTPAEDMLRGLGLERTPKGMAK